MQFVVKRDHLLKSLNFVQGVVEKKNTLPILSNVLLQIKDKKLSLEERMNFQNKLNDLPRNGSAIRHRNRCELTGRPRGNYRKFGLSRIKLRELSMSGDLPGVVKSSW